MRTPATEALWGLPGMVEAYRDNTALGRHGMPDEIAAAVAFLASDDAAWITGHTLPVDGGVLTGPVHLDLTPHGPKQPGLAE